MPRRTALGPWTRAVAGVLAVTLQTSCAPRSEADLLVTGARLVDGTGTPPRDSMSIAILDGRISAVLPDGHEDLPVAADTLAAAGRSVMPGLADMHVHFGRGAPLPRLRDETARVLARELYYGVTSVLQLGGTGASTDSIRVLNEQWTAGGAEAPYVYGTGGHLTLQGSHPIYTIFPPDVRQAADSLAAATPEDRPVDLYGLGIGVSIVDEAAGAGLPVFAHVSSHDELEAVIDGGVTGVVHMVADRPLADAVLAERLLEGELVVVPTLSLFTEPEDLDDPFLRATLSEAEHAALDDSTLRGRVRPRWRIAAAHAGDDAAPAESGAADLLSSVNVLHDHGVPLVVGTDTGNPYVFPGYSVHVELELLVRAGLTPLQAIEAGTRRAAEMIRQGHEFGTVETGKRADLLVLGADPLEDIRNTRTLEVVIAGGRMIDRTALLRRAR